MIFDKTYTCNLVVIGGGELKQASLTCTFRPFTGLHLALSVMRGVLDLDGLHDHKMIDIRRLK